MSNNDSLVMMATDDACFLAEAGEAYQAVVDGWGDDESPCVREDLKDAVKALRAAQDALRRVVISGAVAQRMIVSGPCV